MMIVLRCDAVNCMGTISSTAVLDVSKSLATQSVLCRPYHHNHHNHHHDCGLGPCHTVSIILHDHHNHHDHHDQHDHDEK